MSTKHLTATVATALAFSALTATAAQARPAGIDVQSTAGKVSTVTKVTTHKTVRTGTYTPVPAAPTAAAKTGDGTSLTLVAELAGLVLLGIALIAFWASVRSGRRVRPLPH